jgi:hypothetical protein
MSFPGSWRAGSSLVYALTSGAGTQTNAQQPAKFNSGGGTARIHNLGTVPVFIVFYNYVAAGSSNPTLTFPATGAPPTGQPTIGPGIVAWAVVGAGATAYLDGVSNADSFAVITAATATTVFVQTGEGTGP